MLVPGTRIDRYEILGLIGRGGLAEVYAARHTTLGTQHAIKVLQVPSPSVRQRLVQEGRIQATLEGPHVVRVTDVIEVAGAPALVMDRIDGPSLDRVLADRRLSPAQADHVARGVLAGVADAHRRGLVHRDLKPANVLLSLSEDTPRPRVADFGLAKALTAEGGARPTRSGAMLGTPAYMAPEQVRAARDVDARADVFALGVVLYELFAGTRPFAGTDLLVLLEAASSGDFVPIAERCPALDPTRAAVITRALSPHPDARFADAGAMAAAWAASPPLPCPPWPDLRPLIPEPDGGSPTLEPASASTVDLSGGTTLTAGPAAATVDVADAPIDRQRPWRAWAAIGVVAAACVVGAGLLAGPWSADDATAPPAVAIDRPPPPDEERDRARALLTAAYGAPVPDPWVAAAAHTLADMRRPDAEAAVRASRAAHRVVLAALEDADLPTTLVGIPYVESGFRLQHVSRACAAGPWQFMPETAVQAGLQVADCVLRGEATPWTPSPTDQVTPRSRYRGPDGCRIDSCRVDERLDLARSTAVAVGALAEVAALGQVRSHPQRDALVAWAHALGPGTVLRALQTAPDGDLVAHLGDRADGTADYPAVVATHAAAAACLALPPADRDRDACDALGWPVRLDDVVLATGRPMVLGLQPLVEVGDEEGLARSIDLALASALRTAGARLVTLERGDPSALGAVAGVDHVVHGTVGQLGDTVTIELERTDLEDGLVQAHAYRSTPVDALHGLLDSLLVELLLADEPIAGRRGTLAVVARSTHAMRFCYERALQSDRDLHGRVTLGWTIQPSGRVADVQVVSDDVGDPTLAGCLVRKAEQWLFHPGSAGEVVFPFVFSAR